MSNQKRKKTNNISEEEQRFFKEYSKRNIEPRKLCDYVTSLNCNNEPTKCAENLSQIIHKEIKLKDEKFTKITINKELNETIFEPLSLGISLTGFVTSAVFLLASSILFLPVAIFGGLFAWNYYKLRQKSYNLSYK